MKSLSTTPFIRSILAPVMGIFVVIIFLTIASLYKQTLLEQQRAIHIERLAEIRANIEGAFNGATNLTAGLIAFVSSTGEISQAFFSQLSEALIQQNGLIRNITLAPNNVIQYVYPLSGNEAALGLDLLNHPTQGEATLTMIQTAEPILAGPYELVQGGIGVIHRVPIYVNTYDHHREYWGLMSTPIDFTALLNLSGVHESEPDLVFAMRSLKGTGADGVIFWGKEHIFDHPRSIHTYISVLNGQWEIAALPLIPMTDQGKHLVLSIQVIGSVFAILTTVLIWQILSINEKLHTSQAQYRRLAQHDSLTGLPNRMMLTDRFEHAVARAERNHSNLVLMYLDLDGFKQVNDQHGHQIGDLVLAEVAKRFSDTIRTSDSVVRMGGDEFIVLLEHINHVDAVLSVTDKLLAAIREPIHINATEFTLAMSIGVACFPYDGITLDQLITAADQAMYSAKSNGKNQIRWASKPNDFFESF